MKRREFIKTGFNTTVAATAAMSFGTLSNLWASPQGGSELPFDLVAVRNGEPELMFDKAIESLGGMKTFVSTGQKVVIKPNIGWDVVPERAGNTNPKLIKRIAEHCFNAGAKEVYVFDNTCDEWNKCYKTSMIESYAKEAGAKVVPGNSESYYQAVEIKNGKRLKNTKDLSIAMKNLMGVVWDRMWWHRNDLHQCIADYCTFRPPDLNVIDAYRVMMKNGPRGVSVNDVTTYKTQILSTNIVAADAAATKVFGSEPEDITYITHAADLGVGTYDLTSLNINRIKL
jgi:uncharacterized protein (DUF362 family)